jgi:hypothetical protein
MLEKNYLFNHCSESGEGQSTTLMKGSEVTLHQVRHVNWPCLSEGRSGHFFFFFVFLYFILENTFDLDVV